MKRSRESLDDHMD